MAHQTPTESARLLTSNQAAEYLRCKPQTLRKWRLHGRGPRYVRLGDSTAAPVAYRITDLEAWIAERVFTSTSQETVSR